MAIHDDPKDNQQAGQAQAQSQQPNGYAQAGQQQSTQQPAGAIGMQNVNSVLSRSGSYDGTESRSAEALNALNEASKKAQETQRLNGTDLEILRFDRDANRVGLPSILVVKTVKREGITTAVVRTLLLATDAVRLKPRVQQVGHERIETPTLPQHVFNDTYWSRVVDFLRGHRGMPTLNVLNAGPTVVPADFDFKDIQRTTAVVINSVNRTDDIIAKVVKEEPFNITRIRKDDEFFTSRVDLSGQPTTDLFGNPSRADMVITLGRSSKTAQNEDDFYDGETTFNSLSAFVNLEYTPQQAQPNAWNQAQPVTQILTPTIVITAVKQADWIDANTTELYLFGLGNAYRVTAGTQWARTLLPTVGKKKDLRDIGALGFLLPSGKRIATKGDGFKEQDFAELMGTYVKPVPAFLLDVDPMGPNAAIEGLFLAAAGQGADKARAVQAIVQAANNLYGNLFSQFFDHTKTEIVVPYGVDVNLGYYFDEHNEKRDIRDLGTLEVLNATDGDLQSWTAWYRTMCDQSIPAPVRMKQRSSIEQLYLGSNLHYTGVASRLMLTPDFIQALDKAATAASVAVNFENLTTVFGGQRFQGNEVIGQYTVGAPAQVNYGGQQQVTGYSSTLGTTQAGRSW